MARKLFEVKNPEGLTDLLNTLESAVRESTLRQAAVAGARVLQEEIRLRAPIGPYPHIRSAKLYPAGTLKKNILIYHDEQASAGDQLQTYAVFVGPDAFYARMVEYGTSRHAAHPFIRPAIAAKKKACADAVREVIERKIAEALRGK